MVAHIPVEIFQLTDHFFDATNTDYSFIILGIGRVTIGDGMGTFQRIVGCIKLLKKVIVVVHVFL